MEYITKPSPDRELLLTQIVDLALKWERFLTLSTPLSCTTPSYLRTAIGRKKKHHIKRHPTWCRHPLTPWKMWCWAAHSRAVVAHQRGLHRRESGPGTTSTWMWNQSCKSIKDEPASFSDNILWASVLLQLIWALLCFLAVKTLFLSSLI